MTQESPHTISEQARAEGMINAFRDDFGILHYYLAMHAAYPLAFTPDMLFRLQNHFDRDVRGVRLNIPWYAAADVLLSDLCHEVEYEIYEMNTVVQHILRQRLETHPRFGVPRVHELAHFLQAYARTFGEGGPYMQAFLQAQLWAADAYLSPERAVDRLARRFQNLRQQGHSAEQLQFERLVNALSDSLAEYAPFLDIVRGNASRILGDEQTAQNQFQQAFATHPEIAVGSLTFSQSEMTEEPVARREGVRDAIPVYFCHHQADYVITMAALLRRELELTYEVRVLRPDSTETDLIETPPPEGYADAIRAAHVMLLLIDPATPDEREIVQQIRMARGANVAVLPVNAAGAGWDVEAALDSLGLTGTTPITLDRDAPDYEALIAAIRARRQHTLNTRYTWVRQIEREKFSRFSIMVSSETRYTLADTPNLQIILTTGDYTQMPGFDTLVSLDNDYFQLHRVFDRHTVSGRLRQAGMLQHPNGLASDEFHISLLNKLSEPIPIPAPLGTIIVNDLVRLGSESLSLGESIPVLHVSASRVNLDMPGVPPRMPDSVDDVARITVQCLLRFTTLDSSGFEATSEAFNPTQQTVTLGPEPTPRNIAIPLFATTVSRDAIRTLTRGVVAGIRSFFAESAYPDLDTIYLIVPYQRDFDLVEHILNEELEHLQQKITPEEPRQVSEPFVTVALPDPASEMSEQLITMLRRDPAISLLADPITPEALTNEPEALHRLRQSDVLLVLVDDSPLAYDWLHPVVDVARGAGISILPISSTKGREQRALDTLRRLGLDEAERLTFFDPATRNELPVNWRRTIRQHAEHTYRAQLEQVEAMPFLPAAVLPQQPDYADFAIPHPCHVRLATGDFTRLGAAVVVNPENDYWQLSQVFEDTLSALIRRASLYIDDSEPDQTFVVDVAQIELDDAIGIGEYGQTLPVPLGQVLRVDMGNLECTLTAAGTQIVLHVAALRADLENGRQSLQAEGAYQAVLACLREVEQLDDLPTPVEIAFPVFPATGILLPDVTIAMLNAVHDHLTEVANSSRIGTITICARHEIELRTIEGQMEAWAQRWTGTPDTDRQFERIVRLLTVWGNFSDKQTAIRELGRLGSEDAIDPLMEAASRNPQLEADVFAALAQLDAQNDTRPVTTHLRTMLQPANEPDEQRLAIRALAGLNHRQAQTVLADTLTDARFDQLIQQAAYDDLARMDLDPEQAALVDRWRREAEQAVDPELIQVAVLFSRDTDRALLNNIEEALQDAGLDPRFENLEQAREPLEARLPQALQYPGDRAVIAVIPRESMAPVGPVITNEQEQAHSRGIPFIPIAEWPGQVEGPLSEIQRQMLPEDGRVDNHTIQRVLTALLVLGNWSPQERAALIRNGAQRQDPDREGHLFIAFSRVDLQFAERLSASLREAGLDVWLDTEELLPGMNWREGLTRAIERCAALLLVMSESGLQSDLVREDWERALTLDKLILPLIVGSTDLVPDEIARIQWVDFRDNAYDQGLQRLLDALARREAGLPESTREQLIATGAQPISTMEPFDIYLDFSRTNTAFATQLAQALEETGLRVWMDTQEIPGGTDWREELQAGLARSRIMLLVVTPSAMTSTFVAQNWQFFVQEGKPIVPIMLETAELPVELSRITWADFRNWDFDTAFRDLLAGLAHLDVWDDAPATRQQLVRASGQPLTPASPTYDIYVSYSVTNREFMRRLVRDLQAQNIRVWVDVEMLRPGMNWENETQRALAAARTLVVVLSQAALESQYVNVEMQTFETAEKPLIPIMYEAGSVPPRFRDRPVVDFTNPADYDRALAALITRIQGTLGEPSIARMTAAEVNIRREPGTRFERVGVLSPWQRLTFYPQARTASDDRVWHRIVSDSGSGWVAGDFVTLQTREQRRHMDTPFDEQIGIWHWKGDSVTENSIEELAKNIKGLAPNVGAVLVKVADGAIWQGNFDNSALAIRSVEDITRWVNILSEMDLDFHAWAVPHGTDLTAETDRLIEVCQVPGVRSLILDVEPFQGFWQGDVSIIEPFMQRLRNGLDSYLHIGMAVDPRQNAYHAIFPEEWYWYIDSLHPMLYWQTMQRPPRDLVREALGVWGHYGLPWVPVLQGDSAISPAMLNDIVDTLPNARGLSWWRYGTISNFDLINTRFIGGMTEETEEAEEA